MLTGEEVGFADCGFSLVPLAQQRISQIELCFYACTGARQHSVVYLYIHCTADAVSMNLNKILHPLPVKCFCTALLSHNFSV